MDQIALTDNPHFIVEFEVGIVNRIEAYTILSFIRIGETNANFTTGLVNFTRYHLGCGGPLAGCRFKAQIAVAGDARTVTDQNQAALMALGIPVGKNHQADAALLKIFLLIENKA